MTEDEIIDSNYTQFQKIALLAYLYLKNNATSLEEAWHTACVKLAVKKSAMNKGCLKSTFIGLFAYAHIKGMEKFVQRHSSSKNALYADALSKMYICGKIPREKSKKEKWEFFREHAAKDIQDIAKNNNGQIDVVEIFFEKGLLK